MTGHRVIRFPSLEDASFIKSETTKEYKSGASFLGTLQENKRAGKGIFTWPNGAKYEGEYVNNERFGQGHQIWPDGSSYMGSFVADLRHGNGIHKWANGETYDGSFFRDKRHGKGEYLWPNGSSYSGMFYLNKKEGYGTFKSANGVVFKGLYKDDEREGPGIMTYQDGSEDVGLWRREHLIRLCTPSQAQGFQISSHPELMTYADDSQTAIALNSLHHRAKDVVDTVVNAALDEVERYSEGIGMEKLRRETTNLFSEANDTAAVAYHLDEYEREFFKDAIVEWKFSDQSLMKEQDNNRGMAEVVWAVTKLAKPVDAFKVPTDQSSNGSAQTTARDLAAGEGEGQIVSPNGGATPHSNASQSNIPHETYSDRGEGHSIQSQGQPHSGDGSTTQCSRVSSAYSLASAAGESGLGQEPGAGDAPPCVPVWNKSPALVAMQKHILRYRCFQAEAGFDVSAVLRNKRGTEPPGTIEKASLELLEAASKGQLNKVAQLLNSRAVASDVSDYHGNTPLLMAAINWHDDVMNCLLDNAADVNRLNDDGVSPLSACHVYFYPHDEFIRNLAERYLEPEDDVSTVEEELEEDKRNVPLSASVRWKNLGKISIRKLRRIDAGEILGPQKVRLHHIVQEMVENAKTESEFDSERTVFDMPPEMTSEIIERCATQMSTNKHLIGRSRSLSKEEEPNVVRRLALAMSHKVHMEKCLKLLLKRGADPNASRVPMHVMFFAVKSGDVDAVQRLLMKQSLTDTRLPERLGGLAPLHIAAAIPGPEGVAITKLLLEAGCPPDLRALPDDSFLNRLLRTSCPALVAAMTVPEDEWKYDVIDSASQCILGGRTALQIACAREDDYENASEVVKLLLEAGANPNVLCNGYSPLALCVVSGNDQAVNELLTHGADANQVLTHGAGSVLCVAASTEYEARRTSDARIELINKLVEHGADIMTPIYIGPRRVVGTAVDFAYYMYNLDRRIAHIPYHALNVNERETYNARRRLLSHVGDILREAAIVHERERISRMIANGTFAVTPQSAGSVAPTPNFVFIHGQVIESNKEAAKSVTVPQRGGGVGVAPSSGVGSGMGGGRKMDSTSPHAGVCSGDDRGTQRSGIRSSSQAMKGQFKYCYHCGRSVGVRLAPCSRCKQVNYCSKACKLKAWNARHKEECLRVGARMLQSQGTGTAGNMISPSIMLSTPDVHQMSMVSMGLGAQQSFWARGQSRSPSPTNKDKSKQKVSKGATLNVLQPPKSGKLKNQIETKPLKNQKGTKDKKEEEVTWKDGLPENCYIGNYSWV